MTKHIHYSMWSADVEHGVKGHPQKVMKELGITYQHSVPQSISDSWWFFNCENLPDELPGYLSELKIDNPLDYVGWGLTEEAAKAIIHYKLNH